MRVVVGKRRRVVRVVEGVKGVKALGWVKEDVGKMMLMKDFDRVSTQKAGKGVTGKE